jgi:DNA-binding winged helix-turn-helix (wHTH) protein
MSEKPNKASKVYEFGPFLLNVRERLLTRGDIPIALPPKAFDLLLVLLDNNGSLTKKEDLFELVWPGATVEEGNIAYNIRLVRKALGDSATYPVYIATVSKQGYRFIAPVTLKSEVVAETISPKSDSDTAETKYREEVQRAAAETVDITEDRNADVHWGKEHDYSPLKKHFPHILSACVLYALYYSVAFILETAYQYETYGSRALTFAPFVFFWILITSVVGLDTGLKRTSAGSGLGLLLSVSVFVAAAVLLYFASGLFLPNSAITQASFQTYPAHGAFFKNIYCVLPIAVLFMVVPSHYIVAVERGVIDRDWRTQWAFRDTLRMMPTRAGTVYLKTSWLVGILIGTFLLAFVGSAHLFENLKPNLNMGLFIQLNQWRLVLYFLLGLECVLWYQHAQTRRIGD